MGAFSGKIERGETLACGAAREFLEESCCAVAPDGSDVAPSAADLERTLETVEAVDRLAETARETALHRTYLLPLVFASYPQRFAEKRRDLLELDAVLGRFNLLKSSCSRVPRLYLPGFEAGDLVVTDFGLAAGDVCVELRSAAERVRLCFAVSAAVAEDVAALRSAWGDALACLADDRPLLSHPAVCVRRRHGAVVAAHVDKGYLEKCELAWWPLDEVRRLVAAGQTELFREGFLEVLAKAPLENAPI